MTGFKTFQNSLLPFCIFILVSCNHQSPSEKKEYPASKMPQQTYAETLELQLEQLANDSMMLYLKQHRESLSFDPYRPVYHFSSPDNILHDPNGLCYWNGRWHLFYQFLPSKDSRQHWGHAVSDDLIHWKDLPIAIYPGPENMIYSGATYVEEDRVIAMYWGVDLGVMIATSDDPLLLNWEKIPEPVIPRVLPNSSAPYTVFDPYIWKEGDTYYAISGGRVDGGPGNKKMSATYLFSSTDQELKEWKYEHPFMVNERFLAPGEDASCPYFLPIGDRYIFFFFSHSTASQYLLGDYDKEKHQFHPTFHGRFNALYYAPGGVHSPTAYPDGDGGVVLMHNMLGAKRTPGWRGVTTLPRRLTLVNEDTIRVEPYGDYESLRHSHQQVQNIDLPANKEVVLQNINGNAMEIKAEIDIKNSPMVELNILRSPEKEEFTSIKFYKDRGIDLARTNPKLKGEVWSMVSLETGYSSILPDVRSRVPETLPLYFKDDETLNLHVFVDKSIVEVFVNEKQVLATRVYPGMESSLGVSLKSQGSEAKLLSLDAWQMNSIY
jgi:beta-fructofuranosidase